MALVDKAIRNSHAKLDQKQKKILYVFNLNLKTSRVQRLFKKHLNKRGCYEIIEDDEGKKKMEFNPGVPVQNRARGCITFHAQNLRAGGLKKDATQQVIKFLNQYVKQKNFEVKMKQTVAKITKI